jgi:hypothetical protein
MSISNRYGKSSVIAVNGDPLRNLRSIGGFICPLANGERRLGWLHSCTTATLRLFSNPQTPEPPSRVTTCVRECVHFLKTLTVAPDLLCLPQPTPTTASVTAVVASPRGLVCFASRQGCCISKAQAHTTASVLAVQSAEEEAEVMAVCQ